MKKSGEFWFEWLGYRHFRKRACLKLATVNSSWTSLQLSNSLVKQGSARLAYLKTRLQDLRGLASKSYLGGLVDWMWTQIAPTDWFLTIRLAKVSLPWPCSRFLLPLLRWLHSVNWRSRIITTDSSVSLAGFGLGSPALGVGQRRAFAKRSWAKF